MALLYTLQSHDVPSFAEPLRQLPARLYPAFTHAERTPTVQRVTDLLEELTGGAPVENDHFAFRTFGVRPRLQAYIKSGLRT